MSSSSSTLPNPNSIRPHATNIRASKENREFSRATTNTAEALEKLSDDLAKVFKAVQTLQSVTQAMAILISLLETQVDGLGSATANYLEILLTTASTTISYPSAGLLQGSILSVAIAQDSTGGREIVWDAADFDPNTTVDINLDPDKKARFMFVLASDGFWYGFPPYLEA